MKATQNRSAYEAFKKERCEFLYKAIERFLPDLRDRIVVEYLASPLTHERYNRRFKGSFGPAFQAGKESFPYAKTGIEGLLLCGDSVFPGIGVPAVAASGANAASSTVSITKHVKMMSALKKIRDTY